MFYIQRICDDDEALENSLARAMVSRFNSNELTRTHLFPSFYLLILERCAEIYGAENVTSAARERQESVSGCVVCVSCGDDDSSEKEEANNEAKVIKLIEKMKRNEPHGFSMCSRIYARDERTNEDQVVDFHGDGVESVSYTHLTLPTILRV